MDVRGWKERKGKNGSRSIKDGERKEEDGRNQNASEEKRE